MLMRLMLIVSFGVSFATPAFAGNVGEISNGNYDTRSMHCLGADKSKGELDKAVSVEKPKVEKPSADVAA